MAISLVLGIVLSLREGGGGELQELWSEQWMANSYKGVQV